MHPRIAARLAQINAEALNTNRAAVKTLRARYAVQFGSTDPQGRVTDAIECKDHAAAISLAANACFAFGALAPAYSEDYWRFTNIETMREWKCTTHFVRITRYYV